MINKFLPYLIAFCALGLAGCAAYYSIIGLSKLFAGVATAIIIMSSFLELSKLVTTSLLYQYWNKINKGFRLYLTISVIVLSLITSVGIYGMLSKGYQDTYIKLSINENEIKFLEQKEKFYADDVIRYENELERISNNISTLSNAKASSIQVKDTTSSTGLRNTISTIELRLARDRINVEEENRNKAQSKRSIASDSLQKYQLKILEKQNNTEIAGELGPLKYLSELLDKPMNEIINWLLIVIIFVFDPLAIALVVATNFAFNQNFKKKELNINKIKKKSGKIDEVYLPVKSPIEIKSTYLKNINEEDLDESLPSPNKILIKDADPHQEIINLENKMKQGTWSARKLKELQRLKKLEDELTKRY